MSKTYDDGVSDAIALMKLASEVGFDLVPKKSLASLKPDEGNIAAKARHDQRMEHAKKPSPVDQPIRDDIGLPINGRARIHAWISENVKPYSEFTLRKVVYKALGPMDLKAPKGRSCRLSAWVRSYPGIEHVRTGCGAPRLVLGVPLYKLVPPQVK